MGNRSGNGGPLRRWGCTRPCGHAVGQPSNKRSPNRLNEPDPFLYSLARAIHCIVAPQRRERGGPAGGPGFIEGLYWQGLAPFLTAAAVERVARGLALQDKWPLGGHSLADG